MKKFFFAAMFMLSEAMTSFAQFGVVEPLHVSGNQFRDPSGNKVVLHGVMDTPSPYFNSYRWGNACNDGTVSACLNYFEKIFTGITDTKQGAYCNLFRLHLDPCWTNDPNKSYTQGGGEADISRFSSYRLEKYMQSVYWPIAQKALNHGMYVIMRPPGVCPQTIKVGDAYQNYLKTVWDIVTKNPNVIKNSGTVMIELANEPVKLLNQYGQDTETAMRDFFQPIIDVIRRNGYTGIILVPGTGWQSNYKNYAKYPVNDNNYGYAVHFYPDWYSTSDNQYNHSTSINAFKQSVPVVTSKPIVITEIDWSPQNGSNGHYNEHGAWVTGNYGTWGTGSTTKFGYAYKAVLDYYDNISMTLSGTDTYMDVAEYLKTGKAKAAFNGIWEACAGACWYWYSLWAQKDYAHKSGSSNNNNNNSGSNNNNNNSGSGNSGSVNVDLSSSLIPAWTKGNDRPLGWACNDGGEYPASGEATLGMRVMQFTGGGDFKYGFYIRQKTTANPGYIEYGTTSGHELALNNYGNYCLTFNAAAWSGTPYVKAEVFTPSGNVIASTIVKCSKNLNKNTSASTSNSAQGYLSFYALNKGNYRLRFTPCADANGNGGDWVEAVIGNVNFRYMTNPLAFGKANYVNPGWAIYDGGKLVESGDAGSGPRIFHFTQGGQFNYGLYIRSTTSSTSENYAEYGSRWGYALSFLPGTYTLTYNAAAWAGTPYVKCEVMKEDGTVVGSQTIQCSLNLNKNTNVSTVQATKGTVTFNVYTRGNYKIRWTPVANANGSADVWLEAVIGHIKIAQNSGSYSKDTDIEFELDETTTGIDGIEANAAQNVVYYNLKGQRVDNPTSGVYVVNGKKVVVK